MLPCAAAAKIARPRPEIAANFARRDLRAQGANPDDSATFRSNLPVFCLFLTLILRSDAGAPLIRTRSASSQSASARPPTLGAHAGAATLPEVRPAATRRTAAMRFFSCAVPRFLLESARRSGRGAAARSAAPGGRAHARRTASPARRRLLASARRRVFYWPVPHVPPLPAAFALTPLRLRSCCPG